jgi:ABC-type lipopolysaccharide export system ATPase subunit
VNVPDTHLNLRADGLTKRYRKRAVVQQVSLNVRQGEIVGLLGPNGAGKTTTFYMIVGMIRPDDGTIVLNDEEITNLPMYRRARRGIGYLAQEASVFTHLSVESNIHAVLEFQKIGRAERQARVDRLIEEFRLETVRKSKGYMLSGGERRRTEIARALATEPRFLLLDEPLRGCRSDRCRRDPGDRRCSKGPGDRGSDHRSQRARNTRHYGPSLSSLRRADPQAWIRRSACFRRRGAPPVSRGRSSPSSAIGSETSAVPAQTPGVIGAVSRIPLLCPYL